MNSLLSRLSELRIIPVVIIEDEESAEPLAESLINGGLPCVEITFRTDAARNVLARMRKAFPSLLMGAGTVLTTDQVDRAADAGAEFIVSPGINPKVVEYCLKKNIPITPGIATPTEVEMAIELGMEVVKFFPAEALGGIPYLQAISAPYPKMKFIPTGGINESNVVSYLTQRNVLACGGSWMVKKEHIKSGSFNEIEKLTRSAVSLIGSVIK